MKQLAFVLCLAAVLPAQGEPEPVVVYSCLDAAATRRAQQLLAEALSVLQVTVGQSGDRELFQIVDERRERVDVVLGLDALYAAELASRDRLARYASPAAAGLAGDYRGSDDRFSIPLLSPYAIAFDRRGWERSEAPQDIEDLLFDGRYSDAVVLCTPEAMPGLWVSWIRLQLRRGFPQERAFTWLRTLDAHVVSYEPTVPDVIDAVEAQRGSLTVLPAADIVLASARGLELVLPTSKMTSKGLAVGLVAERDGPEARRVVDVLCAAGFAVAMVDQNLVPSPRPEVPESARGWMAPKMLAYDPGGAGEMKLWFALWHESVRGKGQSYESLDFILELIFAALFAVFLFFVYRHMQSSERKAKP